LISLFQDVQNYFIVILTLIYQCYVSVFLLFYVYARNLQSYIFVNEDDISKSVLQFCLLKNMHVV